jgi:hypothetical protein
MVNRIQTAAVLLPAIEERLTDEDDPALWRQVLRTLAEDASVVQAANHRLRLYAEVGICSHWLRPHQTRWTAGGGFAFPAGYGDGEGFSRGGLPGFDWSAKLQFDPALLDWIVPLELPTKRIHLVRIAVPARTARHRQAAVHTLWSPGTLDLKEKRTVFYGFRNLSGGWELIARSKEH